MPLPPQFYVFHSHFLDQEVLSPHCQLQISVKCKKVPVEEVHTECRKVVKIVEEEICEDDSLLRNCIETSLNYK